MRSHKIAAFVVCIACALALPRTAVGGFPTRVGTRALGMGGALRASATGDAAPMLNPAGMSLLRSYVMEGSYQLDSGDIPESAHRAHVSVVDSTSATNIGGGLYYTYLSSDVTDMVTTSGHEAGVSLSFPFGDYVAVGTTLKYLMIDTDTDTPDAMGGTMTSSLSDNKLTFDLGAIIRPTPAVGIALVGHNLAKTDSPFAPRALGFGSAAQLIPNLTVTVDGVADFDSVTDAMGEGQTKWRFGGGAEYVLPAQIALRAGGGSDGVRDTGFLTAGASALSQMGAIDLGFLRDVSGDLKQTILAVSVRLFVNTQ